MKSFSDIKQSIQKTLHSNTPIKIKRCLIQGLYSELKAMERMNNPSLLQISYIKQLKTEATDTNYSRISHLSLNSQDISSLSNNILSSSLNNFTQHHLKQQIELKILQKQRQKIYYNQEIQNYQDDYYQLQKILMTKKEYNDELDKQILKKTFQINKLSRQEIQIIYNKDQERKSLSSRIKDFFIF